MNNNDIKILDDISHVLLRPSMYIGSVSLEKTQGFLFNKETQKFEYKEYEYVQGFFKLIDEIITNSCDEFQRTNGKFANQIEVDIKDNTISIKDNGRGVPITPVTDEKGKQISQLEAAFTRLRAGSNFSDENRNTGGMNGFGCTLVAIYSKEFQVKVQTSIGKGKLICKNNLSSKKCIIDNNDISDKTYTEVIFTPDYDKFGLTGIDDIHEQLLLTRLVNLSIAYPQIKFKYNGKALPKLKPEMYLSYFGDVFEQVKGNSKFIIGLLPNNLDNFIQFSYINGLDIKKGGNHIDFLLNEIISRLRQSKTFKKYNVTPSDIRNKVKLVCILRDFPNMQFNSQTKEQLTNPVSSIREYFKDIDFDKFVSSIAKNNSIIDPIIINYKIKEQVKEQLALKNSIKIEKNFKWDKYLPATKDKQILFITEGDSAQSAIIPILGRSFYSYVATRGIPLNGWTSSSKELSNNEELTNIIKLLNLDISKNEPQILSHKYVVLLTDADFDAFHIQGLYLGFFAKYAKWMLDNHLIKRLKTPVAFVLENKKPVKYWFSLDEMNKYLITNKIKSNQTLKYAKGLGVWKPETLKHIIDNNGGLEAFLEDFDLTEYSIGTLDNWVGDKTDNVLSRKEYLKNYNVNLEEA